MNGLGFIHPGFLAAGIAVAVPIIIHLLFRQKARRVDIGSIYFLRVVLRDQAHRRKVRRWLLLALRAAGVLLLAALFARPYWRALESPAEAGAVILLLDRSASMGAGRKGKTPWDLARQKARKIIDELPAGSTLHLAYFDASGITPTTPEELLDRAGPSALREQTIRRRSTGPATWFLHQADSGRWSTCFPTFSEPASGAGPTVPSLTRRPSRSSTWAGRCPGTSPSKTSRSSRPTFARDCRRPSPPGSPTRDFLLHVMSA